MKVSELLQHGFIAVTLPDGDREIDGAYIGDLLSWVMGRCCSGNAWITIMSNVNILAVATLADPSVIILSENVTLPPDIVSNAEAKGVNIVSTPLPSYEAAVQLSELLK